MILAIGVSLFVFGKPALVNLTNQVLHHDTLKATMQAPSLTSLYTWHVSAVNNNIGVSKHAFIVASTKDILDDSVWNYGTHQLCFPEEIRKTPIPYNSYVKVIFKLKVDKPVRLILDVSDYPITGNTWDGNDNDNLDSGKRAFFLDNKSITKADVTPYGDADLSADKWYTIEYEYENTASANTQHVALSDASAIDFGNNSSNNVNVQTKDFVFAVDNIKYR